MKTEPDVSVLIVSFNVAPFVGACLSSIAPGCGAASHEVIVVDNASADDSVAAVAAARPDATIVTLDRNVGFSRGVNQAMARSSGRHLLLLNPDAQAAPGAIERLVRFLDDRPDVGVAAPRLLNPDGSDQGTARRFPTPAAAVFGRRSPLTRLFPSNPWAKRYLVGVRTPNDEPFDVDWVSGACLLTRRDVVENVGGLDESFFMYWEDADWCHRVQDAGWRVVTVPDAVVVHAEGGSRRGWPPRQVAHFHRSAYRYYAKHELRGIRRPLRIPTAALLATRAAGVATISAARSHRLGAAR